MAKSDWRVGLFWINARDRITNTIERFIKCRLRRHHHVKLGSQGHCCRCGKRVPGWR